MEGTRRVTDPAQLPDHLGLMRHNTDLFALLEEIGIDELAARIDKPVSAMEPTGRGESH